MTLAALLVVAALVFALLVAGLDPQKWRRTLRRRVRGPAWYRILREETGAVDTTALRGPTVAFGDTVTGRTAANAHQDLVVSFPQGVTDYQIVTALTTTRFVDLSPIPGALVQIDATVATGDIAVTSAGVTTATALAGEVTWIFCTPQGLWRLLQGDTGDQGPLFTSVLAKGMVDANQANLAAFAVNSAATDGLTYAQGDIVVLNKQTTVAENGPYIVGAVVAGNAPLTRPAWWATGSVIPDHFNFQLAAGGTLYGGLVLTSTAGAAKVVGTDDPILLFRQVNARVTAAMTGYTTVKGLGAITHTAGGDINIANVPGVDFTKMVPQTSVNAVAFFIAVNSVTSATVLRVVATNITTGVNGDQAVDVTCNLAV